MAKESEKDGVVQNKGKGIFPAIIKKVPFGYLRINLGRNRVSITAFTDEEGNEEAGIAIFAEELSDVISVLKEAKKILEEKEEQNG
ncbi:hypothetical protein J7J62_05700, partial [bacterium]|nr:hypothetical protein [bacterium]